MKGRRKVKTNKWALIKAYKEEAHARLKRGESKFIRLAIAHGRLMEPPGVLAGKAHSG